MAKEPIAGRSKTRLIPALGADGAAALSRAMTLDVLDLALASGLHVTVALDGDLHGPFAREIAPLPVEPQIGATLGDRLAHALRGGGIAIGTDAPTLPLAMILEAATAPEPFVISPSRDGGYVLVAVDDAREIFDGVPWSDPGTFAAQVARARALGWEPRVLPAWYDVDEARDLGDLADALAQLPPDIAPRTRAFLGSRHAALDR
jgi:glycosyltransferase A (GT-A) superfamily protein (DUF2064 family)